MSKHDKRFLEWHGQSWRVSVPVPRQLQQRVGKTKLKQSLKTDSIKTANLVKWSVIAELQKQIRQAQDGSPHDPLLEEALALREALRMDNSAGLPHEFTTMDAIRLRGDEIAGEPIAEDPDTGEAVFDEERLTRAGYFVNVAAGTATPIGLLLSQWHQQSVNRKERTKGDDIRALSYLEAWCRTQHLPPTVEAITRKIAGRFIADLPTIAASAKDGRRLTNKTSNKYLSSLSAYWKWLKGRGEVEDNVWRGQFLPKEQRSPEDEPREFTDMEVAKLLGGTPEMACLGPLMRIAALTGARIDAIVSLRVKDCQNGSFRFKPQKREKRERLVPIHSALVPVVAALTVGRGPDDDLFPEMEVPPAGSQRERSMPAVKAFGRYRKKLGVHEQRDGHQRSRITFHSFRRWFTTKAERAGIPETTIQSVVGHKRAGMTFGVYSAGPDAEQLRACVEAVVLPTIPDPEPLPRPTSACEAPSVSLAATLPRRRHGRFQAAPRGGGNQPPSWPDEAALRKPERADEGNG